MEPSPFIALRIGPESPVSIGLQLISNIEMRGEIHPDLVGCITFLSCSYLGNNARDEQKVYAYDESKHDH